MDESKTKYCLPRVKGSQLSCTLVGVLSVLFNLRRVAVLLHGTAGCAYVGLRFCEQMMLHESEILADFRLRPLAFRTTGLSENELIFGGEERLRMRISEMLDAFPDMPVMVVPSCTVEVIGDDVEGVCEDMSRATGRTILYLKMGGFLKGDHYEGLNSAYFDLIDRFLAPSSNIDLGAVNLVAERCLSPTTDIDCREIARLLGLLGLRINTRFVHNMAYEDLSKVTEAGLNLPAVHNQSIAVCEYLYKELNMPFVREGFPSGFKDTRIWLQSIKETLSLSTDIDGLMDAERTFFMNELDRLGNPLKDLKVVVNTLPIHIGWLIEFLELSGADLLEVNILDSAYFQKEFMDALDTLPCAVNQHMSFEDILANNRRSGADVLLQCSALHSSIPHHQPGLLIKEVPVVPPVGPRGLLNLFVNWSQWMRSTEVEGWRNEQLV